MKTIRVPLKERSHDIIIGRGVLNSAGRLLKKLKLGSDAYIITNARVKALYGQPLEKSLRRSGISAKFKLVADSERSKSIENAAEIIRNLAAYDGKKKVFIIALGGGVIGDLAGFAASIYKRGVPYIQIPTTLLAQVDSAIGGKTAIDLKEGKNLAGAFYQPRLILSDINCLKSLSARQIKTGLAEAVKYGIIKDKALFRYLEENHKKILAGDEAALEFIVYRCSRIKAGIIVQDEREIKHIRTILNFGHTIGHAIETAGTYRGYNHGEAVALGMLCAKDISLSLKLINRQVSGRIEDLIRALGLPAEIKKAPLKKIIEAHYHDKKFAGRKNRFVLIKGNNTHPVIKENIPLGLIEETIKNRMYNNTRR
ncbi:MAG: 3-dehydroquinate synthase [Candidatus Omnitrophota bacterium]